MIVYVLNDNFEKAGIIDNASSTIFTRRYNEAGDFELYVAATDDNVELLMSNKYVWRDKDNTVYVIQNIGITDNAESGNYIIVSGENIATALRRRIIWNQTNFTGTVENCIRKYINENAISSVDTDRNIPLLQLGDINNFSEEITVQKTGDNLLSAVSELCKTYGYGFNVLFDGTSLTFNLYKGEQKNVTFSPEYDNLISSEYKFSDMNYANVALVAGEGEGTARTKATFGSAAGIDRYEIFVDARDLSTNENAITAAEYQIMLQTRGIEKLSEYQINEEISGEIETTNTYAIGVDYNLGDIVKIKNQYGITATSRIIETIECEDENGYSFIPTFSTWEVQ